MLYNIIKNKKGLTLMEMVVAVALFAILMLSAVQIFQAVVEGQRNAMAAQNIQESIRYVLETTAKEIRSAQDSIGNECSLAFGKPDAVNKVFNTADGGAFLYFKNKSGDCTAYSVENNRLKIIRGANAGYITPDEIKIDELKFIVADDLINNSPRSLQPKVSLEMQVEAVGKELHKQILKIQTTISARYYE